jgi:hypothetical protein
LTDRPTNERRGTEDTYAARGPAYAEERGTSWISVILGLLTALGAGLILSGIVGGIVGAILGAGGARQSAAEGGASGLVGLLITLFLAFLIGGYAAGRMASRSGVGSGHRDRPHKLQRRDAARGPRRHPATSPAEPGRHRDGCRNPCPPLAVRRGCHRRRLGRQDRTQERRRKPFVARVVD